MPNLVARPLWLTSRRTCRQRPALIDADTSIGGRAVAPYVSPATTTPAACSSPVKVEPMGMAGGLTVASGQNRLKASSVGSRLTPRSCLSPNVAETACRDPEPSLRSGTDDSHYIRSCRWRDPHFAARADHNGVTRIERRRAKLTRTCRLQTGFTSHTNR
jgi:hypothetical protein